MSEPDWDIHPDLRTRPARLDDGHFGQAADEPGLPGDGPALSRDEIIGTVRELGDGMLEEGLVHRVRQHGRPREIGGRPVPDVSGLLDQLPDY